jgi:tetratricopeptide (TPR) repeat protein
VLKAGTHLGPYEIVAPIGAGGMGEVFRARDTRLGRDVAIKVLPTEFALDAERLKRFEREAKATAALSHPNILAVYDVGTHEGVPYLVEELLEGESLRQRLARGSIPVREAIGIAAQVAHGLAAAHEKHIVHRDLKPENVFLTREGTVKILDFGLAKLVESVPLGEADTLTYAPTGATEFGRVLGTMAYMAPEQARGMPVDQRVDIFSFGVVLYEMLAGERPFRGETATDTVAAILKEEPPPLPEGVPPALQGVVTQCLAKRPDQRFSSGHDLELALQAVSGESGTASAPTPARRPWHVWLFAHRTLAGVIAILLVAAAFVGLVTWRPWKPKPSRAGTAVAVVPSLVAMPCKVLGSPESAYLTDAIPSTISTLLGEVQGMDTKVPPTSFEVEKVHGDLDKIANVYGVQTFVLSTATAEGDHLVFNIQLADARTRKVRWSHQYQGSRANYTAMAHEAAQGICKAVLPNAAPAVPTSSPTSNSESELAFQQGRYYTVRYLEHGDRVDFDRALKALNRAFELNPKDAAAAAQIAYLYGVATLARGDIPRPQGIGVMEAWVQKALALDPKCSMAWVARTFLEGFKPDADLEKQIEWSLKGAQLGPGSPDAQQYLLAGLATGGSVALAIEALRKELTLDPLAFDGYSFLALLLARSGRPTEALPVLDTLLSLDPGTQWAPAFKVYALLEMGQTKEAATLFKRQNADWPSGGYLGDRVQDIRWLLSLAADDDRSVRASLKAIRARFADPAVDWNALQDTICDLLPAVNRRFGEDTALDLLILSTKRGATMPYDTLMLRPDLKDLREDPRAKDAIQKTKASFDLLMRILREARARSELPTYLEKPMDDLLKQLTEQGAWS